MLMVNLCGCGCGGKLIRKQYNPMPTYLPGHQNFGKVHSDEHKRKVSLTLRGRVLSEEHKKKIGLSNKGKPSSMKGEKHTERTKKKMSVSMLKRKEKYGYIHTPETRIKIGLSRKGKKLSEETKKKISNGLLGRKTSEETRMKLREFNLGKKMSGATKKKISDSLKKGYGTGSIKVSGCAKMAMGGEFKGDKNPLYGRRGEKNHFYGKKREKSSIDKFKEFRKNQIIPVKDSSIEIKIQKHLKELGIAFCTHRYMKEIEHAYQCDILIPSKNLVIECDGDHWHKYPTGNEIDHIRTRELIDKGFKVLRLWERDIRRLGLIEFNEKINSISS